MPFGTARGALEYRPHPRPRPTGPPPVRSRRHTGSREKGTDHGKKDTGEGVLRLRSSNLSLNAIAAALHASKASVSDVLRAAAEHDVAWEEAERMSAGEVYARLFPEREQPGPVHPDPDWDAVHAELARVGVTLRLLHGEYREECAARGEAAMSYDRFCKRYGQFTVGRNVVSRVGRKAGRNMEVDWSGPTPAPKTAELVGGWISRCSSAVGALE